MSIYYCTAHDDLVDDDKTPCMKWKGKVVCEDCHTQLDADAVKKGERIVEPTPQDAT